ncbi:hypothetical protein ACU5AX_08125 [Sphingomonas sp. XXL09]|uniref:hypothetical protein n=1 Tax=Sphingomonas sp. XXL09 TaxID=3457787 RepID=UPI00406BA472
MNRTPEEDRDYWQRRCAAHRAMAARCDDPAQRGLHERFAALYAARWHDVVVEGD